jgi:hypothetical protein
MGTLYWYGKSFMAMQSHVCRGIPYFNNRFAPETVEHQSRRRMQKKSLEYLGKWTCKEETTTFLHAVLCSESIHWSKNEFVIVSSAIPNR